MVLSCTWYFSFNFHQNFGFVMWLANVNGNGYKNVKNDNKKISFILINWNTNKNIFQFLNSVVEAYCNFQTYKSDKAAYAKRQLFIRFNILNDVFNIWQTARVPHFSMDVTKHIRIFANEGNGIIYCLY